MIFKLMMELELEVECQIDPCEVIVESVVFRGLEIVAHLSKAQLSAIADQATHEINRRIEIAAKAKEDQDLERNRDERRKWPTHS